MDKEYKALLLKYAGDVNLLKLIDLCVIDLARQEELSYLKDMKYPDKRDLLGKLKTDIMLTKVEFEEINKNK